jgi:hypothetical protein
LKLQFTFGLIITKPKIMKQNFFLILFLIAFNCLFAQSNATITVTDITSGNPIQGASITLNNVAIQTDVAGQAIFTNIANGSYSYTISKTCYLPTTDNVVIAGANVAVSKTITAVTSNDVNFGMSNFGFNPSGFSINLTNGTYNQTIASGNPLGDYFSAVPFGTYTYTISKNCFQTATGQVVVNCNGGDPNFVFSIPAAVTSNDVNFGMSNFGNNPSGFSINLTNGTYNQTIASGNPLGDYFSAVPFGTYTYTISKNCFQTATGQVVVNCNGGDPNFVFAIPAAVTTNGVFFFLSNFSNNPSGFTINLSNGTYNETIISGNPLNDVIENVPFGTYTYTISKECNQTITGQVTVNCNNGEANAVVEIPTEIVIDNTVVQTDNILTANEAGATYQWLDCNNNNAPIVNATSQVFTATVDGSYAVEVSIGSCSTVSDCLTVSNLSVGNNQKTAGITIFPNPANDNINVKFDKNFETLSVEIISMTGQVVKRINAINNNLVSINIEELASGIYNLRTDDKHNRTSSRIVKK